MKRFVFDIDGTVCSEEKAQERMFAKPKQDVIDFINKLYNEGHTIILYTARGWDQQKVTENWLKTNNVNYHTLILGKPIYDYWIDDRSVNVNDLGRLMNEF